jgi:pyridoxine/pyridoxamine 5'-phosphate oxidase
MSQHKPPVRKASRPHIAASYGIDHGPEGMMPWDVVTDWLSNARNYWVGTTRPDGKPHAAPVWGVWLDDGFYFCTDRLSRKGRNLVANRELVVHLESGDDAAILEGTAEEVTEGTVMARFVDAYEAKYQIRPVLDSESTIAFVLRPRVAYAWREKDFPKSATRWHFHHG